MKDYDISQFNICKWYSNNFIDNSKFFWYPNTKIEFNNNKYSNNIIKFENSINNYDNYFNDKIKEIKIVNKEITYEEKIKDINKSYEIKKQKLFEKYNDDSKNYEIKLKTLETKFKKNIFITDKVLKVEQFNIKLNKEQKNIIFKWFFECDKVYNKTIEWFNNKNPNFSLDYKTTKIKIFDELYKGKKDAPYDVLTDEVRIAISNIKSCLTNIKNKNIEKFNIREKKYYNRRSILIPSKSINKNGIFSNILGKIENFKNLISTKVDNIISDCRLVYDKLTKQFTLYVPLYKNKKEIQNKKDIIALDPGEKIFQTYYSRYECGKIGENIRTTILKYQYKIKRYQRILKNNKNKKDKILHNKNKIKNKIRKYYKKIKNIVKDMHNKTAKYLCENYKNIILPNFKTQKMVIKREENINNKNKMKLISKGNKLNKRIKFVLNQLSHYKFKQHLLHKSNEYGCNLYIVTEEYTSQCCGNCGVLEKKYTKERIKECSFCNSSIHRDINGSRNILLKSLNELKFKIVRS